MQKRWLLMHGFIAGMLYLMVPQVDGSQLTEKPPNIVFIIVDDLGWNDVSFHGNKEIPTPNIDALARDGVILNHYYVAPQCSPSRGSLMTGKHPIKIGFQHRVILADSPWGLSTKEKILPQWLNDLGYVSHGVGKWHLGFFKEEYLPTKRGFESFFGYWTGVEDYYTHVSAMENKEGLDLHDGSKNLRGYNGTYGTTLFTMKAKHVIETHDRSKPLFLYFGQQAVHTGNFKNPLQAPESYIQRFPHISDQKRKVYAGMVSALDESIGHIFTALNNARMLDDTIIVFTTDNGGAVQGTDGNSASNYPLRGSKYTLLEGGTRAVGFVWSKELRSKSRVFDHQLMHISDWLPTLYAAAGGNVKNLGDIDGWNMWPALFHDIPSPRKEVLLNIDPLFELEGLRKDDYKIVKGTRYEGRLDGWFDKNGKDYDGVISNDPGTNSAILDKTYLKFLKQSKIPQILFHQYNKSPISATECTNPHDECQKLKVSCGPKQSGKDCDLSKSACLFNIREDPCEYNNIADDLPQVVEELEDLLDVYRYTAVVPRNKPSDEKMDPKNTGFAWVPWKF